jgi:hypothetical protein
LLKPLAEQDYHFIGLYQFNGALFQSVKQRKCFPFRKIGMQFFHRLIVIVGYLPELGIELCQLDIGKSSVSCPLKPSDSAPLC